MNSKQQELFNKYMPIVYTCRNKLSSNPYIKVFEEDLLQEGFIALYQGVINYDPTKCIAGNPSAYFRKWISGRMQKCLNEWMKEPSYCATLSESEYNLDLNKNDTVLTTSSYIEEILRHYIGKIKDSKKPMYLKKRLLSKKNLDEVHTILKLIDLGLKRKEIAQQLGYTRYWLAQKIDIIKENLIDY